MMRSESIQIRVSGAAHEKRFRFSSQLRPLTVICLLKKLSLFRCYMISSHPLRCVLFVFTTLLF